MGKTSDISVPKPVAVPKLTAEQLEKIREAKAAVELLSQGQNEVFSGICKELGFPPDVNSKYTDWLFDVIYNSEGANEEYLQDKYFEIAKEIANIPNIPKEEA